MRRVKIHDVAREAGVSITVVSRALNGKDELSPQTRDRVLAAATRLGYVPSSTARALASGKTRTLGVIVNDNTSPVNAAVLSGVEEVAHDRGYGLLFANSAQSQEQALRCISMLQSRQVDGILITPVQSDRRDIELLQASELPFVLLIRRFPDLAGDFVVCDNVEAGRLATEHLLALGHRRIGHIAGPAETSTASERLRGYREAFARRDLPIDETLTVSALFTVAGGREAARQLLSLAQPPTAIFAATDMQAVGALKCAHDFGLRVPQDLAVVGGDDIELAEYLEPPLTTFSQGAREIGKRGAQILIDRLAGDPGTPHREILIPQLKIRESSGWKV